MSQLTTAQISRRGLLGGLAAGSLTIAGGALLGSCAADGQPQTAASSSGAGSKQVGGSVRWTSWGNPGENERLVQYSKEYAAASGTKVTYQATPGDYLAKLLTQLQGGSAPDCFYVGDTQMAKFIEVGAIEDMAPYLAQPDSPTKETDLYAGLSQWCKPASGSGLYGLVVDCNPKILWFNKDLLTQAGVTQTPAEQFAAGTWTRDAFTDLLAKVTANGKRAAVLEANWFDLFSWITTLGGTAFDDAGMAVFDTDPKALEALAWLFDQLESGAIAYAGSLPKGQGVDALFYAKQLATIGYGRWILPNLKKIKGLSYDVAPLPTLDGSGIAPVAVYTAAIAVNKKAQSPEAAKAFAAAYVSRDGQRSRLSGGGNAVPVSSGLDDVVTEGNLPEHAAFFTEIANKGYAVPLRIARNAELAAKLPLVMDELIKKGTDSATFASEVAKLINS